MWNTTTGACVNSVDTKSQVSALLWNKEHKELVSAHGFSQNQLIVWKYPTMTKVAELSGHSQRVLSMAMSPDATTVVSAGADETLRFWKCFARYLLHLLYKVISILIIVVIAHHLGLEAY